MYAHKLRISLVDVQMFCVGCNRSYLLNVHLIYNSLSKTFIDLGSYLNCEPCSKLNNRRHGHYMFMVKPLINYTTILVSVKNLETLQKS